MVWEVPEKMEHGIFRKGLASLEGENKETIQRIG